MANYIICHFCLLSIAIADNGAEIAQIKNTLVKDCLEEVFFVHKNDSTIKQGLYIKLYFGDTIIMGNYANNKRQGIWYFYTTGKQYTKARYKNDSLDGDFFAYAKNGQLRNKKHYTNNECDRETTYYKNGNIQLLKQVMLNNTTSVSTFYDNKQLKQLYSINNKSNDITGIYKSYFENGWLKILAHLRNDSLTDTLTHYFENGTIEQKIVFNNNCPINVLEYKDLKGNTLDYGTLKNGEGTFIEYNNALGVKTQEFTIKNNVLNGEYKGYHKKQIVRKGYFLNGLKHGEFTNYDFRRNKTSLFNYKLGLREGDFLLYKKQKIVAKGAYIKDKREGVIKIYNKNYKKEMQQVFKNDAIYGINKFYIKGKLKLETDLKYSTPIGELLTYNRRGEIKKRIKMPNIDEEKYGNSLDTIVTTSRYFGNLKTDYIHELPEFINGEEDMMKFLRATIKYPNDAKKNDITGTVYTTFIINEVGEMSDCKIVSGVHADMDNEVWRVLHLFPTWTPGTVDGANAKVLFNLPVRFSLR